MQRKQSIESYIGTFLYLIQVKAILFIVISATSYYQFLGSTPFEIVRGIIVSVGNSSQNTGVCGINLAMTMRCG